MRQLTLEDITWRQRFYYAVGIFLTILLIALVAKTSADRREKQAVDNLITATQHLDRQKELTDAGLSETAQFKQMFDSVLAASKAQRDSMLRHPMKVYVTRVVDIHDTLQVVQEISDLHAELTSAISDAAYWKSEALASAGSIDVLQVAATEHLKADSVRFAEIEKQRLAIEHNVHGAIAEIRPALWKRLARGTVTVVKDGTLIAAGFLVGRNLR